MMLGCFVCIQVCALHACLVYVEARRELEFQEAISYRVSAWN